MNSQGGTKLLHFTDKLMAGFKCKVLLFLLGKSQNNKLMHNLSCYSGVKHTKDKREKKTKKMERKLEVEQVKIERLGKRSHRLHGALNPKTSDSKLLMHLKEHRCKSGNQ